MPWEAKKEYVRTKYQRADYRINGSNLDFTVAFWILGLLTNQTKTFKSRQEGTEASFYYGDKGYFIRSKG